MTKKRRLVHRVEIPEPLDLPKLLRARFKKMSEYEFGDEIWAVFKGTKTKLAEDIDKYWHYIRWLHTAKNDEYRCHYCKKLYLHWGQDWHEAEIDMKLKDGWQHIGTPFNLRKAADRQMAKDGWDSVFGVCCRDCRPAHRKALKKK